MTPPKYPASGTQDGAMQVLGTAARVCCARLFIRIGMGSICSSSVKEEKKKKGKKECVLMKLKHRTNLAPC